MTELDAMRAARSRGAPLADLVAHEIERGGRQIRLAAAQAFREYEQAITAMRAAIVHELVGDGFSLTDIARRMGISRQSVARLYQLLPEDVPAAGGGDGP